MTSPPDNKMARARPHDNFSGAADDARPAVTASTREKSWNASNAAGDEAAWEAEVDRIAEPASSLEDTLRSILDEIADDVL